MYVYIHGEIRKTASYLEYWFMHLAGWNCPGGKYVNHSNIYPCIRIVISKKLAKVIKYVGQTGSNIKQLRGWVYWLDEFFFINSSTLVGHFLLPPKERDRKANRWEKKEIKED